MAKYTINQGHISTRVIDAVRFATVGDFVDFYDENDEVVFRISADRVGTVERTEK